MTLEGEALDRMPESYTTISADPETRDHLRSLKRGQESYSELIARLCEEAGYPPPHRN